MKNLLLLATCILWATTIEANCTINKQKIGALYEIRSISSNGKLTTGELLLWRNGKIVAHQYLDKNYTDLWTLTSNEQLHMVRHFDKYQHGVEYQPSEIKLEHTSDDWQIRRQLISDNMIKSMRAGISHGLDCNLSKTYHLGDQDKTSLIWRDKLDLVEFYQEKTASGRISWQLKEVISDDRTIDNFFKQLDSYQTTDYADVGDNESDPFLQKMINLGFVEHAASGFYDSQGRQLKGGHSH